MQDIGVMHHCGYDPIGKCHMSVIDGYCAEFFVAEKHPARYPACEISHSLRRRFL